MRTLIISLMASTVAVLAFTQVQAADMVDEIPAAPAADYSAAPAGDWSGAYVGGTGSYNWGKFDGNKGSKRQDNGVGGGLYGGYNMQNGQMVYGAEADVGYSGLNEHVGATKVEQGVNGSLRGRVGVALDPVMVYGTAGVAGANIKASDGTSSDKRGAFGWTAGAGVEAKVTDTISARVEYRYSDYGSRTYKLDSGNYNRDMSEQGVRVGVGMKF